MEIDRNSRNIVGGMGNGNGDRPCDTRRVEIKGYVRYAIDKEEVRRVLKGTILQPFFEEEVNELAENNNFLEVWQGLPRYTFEETASRGNLPCFRAEGPGIYIWVMSDAYAAIQKNPNQLLFALGNRRQGSVDFFCVVPAPEEVSSSVVDAVALAKLRNKEGIPEMLGDLRKQKR